jgi:hypothetical protein
MRERWVGRGLAAVVLVLGMFLMFLAQDGVVGTTPYGSTWSCGSLLAPKAIALPSPMETPADFADDLAAAQGACAEARDVRAAEVIRVGFFAALVGMTSFGFRRRRDRAPAEPVRVAG